MCYWFHTDNLLLIKKHVTLNRFMILEKGKCMCWKGPPAPARKLEMAGTPAKPRFAALQEKTSGTYIRLKFVGFNFGHVQLLMFVVVMIRSYSFCYLDLVM